jgi:D-sedoheptulose 7-phosphate isomerase
MSTVVPTVADQHLTDVAEALTELHARAGTLERWGAELAERLLAGHRLLAAGNGGSAAQAQHLTAELVGRFRADRRPLSAIALHAETSSVTALVNDFGAEAMFERQVEAHGRPGDVLILLSTSGNSPNLVRAAATARRVGMRSWAMTGAGPNRLDGCADEVITIDRRDTAVIQDLHQVAIHILCACVDRHVVAAEPGTTA